MAIFALTISVPQSSMPFSQVDEEEMQFERPYGRYGGNARQLDYKVTEELATREIEKEKSWLLDPRIFEHLSSAGKRAALMLNGRLTIKDEHHQVDINSSIAVDQFEDQSDDPAKQPSANSKNVRVNNPALDTASHTQSESAIAVNGKNIIVSFNDFSSQPSAYSFSIDGGKTFNSMIKFSGASGKRRGIWVKF